MALMAGRVLPSFYDTGARVGRLGNIVHRSPNMPYLTRKPEAVFNHYNGECPLHLEPPTVKMIYTVEVRWPGGLSTGTKSFTLAIDDAAFVFVGTLVKQVCEFTKRDAAAVSERAEVKFTDTWKPYITEMHDNGGIKMQRLFTIEIRVDFRDEDKLPLFQKVCQQAARHIYAQSGLLGDGVKPEIVIHSHDFYAGHVDIPMFEDEIATGEVAITEAADGHTTTTTAGPQPPLANGEPVPEGFSEELMRALK